MSFWMNFGIVCVLIGITFLGFYFVSFAFAEEYDINKPSYIWVPGHGHKVIDGFVHEYPYIQIPIKYIDKDVFACGYRSFQACFQNGPEPWIEFKNGTNVYHKVIHNDSSFLSVWEHEVLHAWGVSHAEMGRWFNPLIDSSCPCPEWPRIVNGFYVR